MGELITAFGLDWRLLIIQMINFGLVLLVLWYFLYRPVMRMIDKRERKMREGVENAARVEQLMKDVEEQKNKILTNANTEAEKLYADGKTYALEKRAEILREAKERSEKAIHEAEEKGMQIKEQLLRESKSEIAKMAVLGAEKILREHGEKETK